MQTKLQDVREEKGLSRDGLAQKSGVTRQTILNLETGADPIKLQDRIRLALVKALRTSSADMFRLEKGRWYTR